MDTNEEHLTKAISSLRESARLVAELQNVLLYEFEWEPAHEAILEIASDLEEEIQLGHDEAEEDFEEDEDWDDDIYGEEDGG